MNQAFAFQVNDDDLLVDEPDAAMATIREVGVDRKVGAGVWEPKAPVVPLAELARPLLCFIFSRIPLRSSSFPFSSSLVSV